MAEGLSGDLRNYVLFSAGMIAVGLLMITATFAGVFGSGNQLMYTAAGTFIAALSAFPIRTLLDTRAKIRALMRVYEALNDPNYTQAARTRFREIAFEILLNEAKR